MIPNDATNIECVKNGSCGPVSDALWNIKYHTDVICVIDDVKPVHRKFLIVIYFLPGNCPINQACFTCGSVITRIA